MIGYRAEDFANFERLLLYGLTTLSGLRGKIVELEQLGGIQDYSHSIVHIVKPFA
jgi:hypothetical protein